jgi:hypothetical protein
MIQIHHFLGGVKFSWRSLLYSPPTPRLLIDYYRFSQRSLPESEVSILGATYPVLVMCRRAPLLPLLP